jgi:carboxyl-terminal processing protease
MSTRGKVFVIAFSTIVVFYTVVGGILSHAMSFDSKDNKYVQMTIFDAVLRHVVRDYVDEPDLEKVRMGALRGLADGLDPYSAYLTPKQVADYKPNRKVTGDTGMVVSKVGGFGYVVTVQKGSPADTIGVKAGDFIEYIGKTATRDISLYDLLGELNGDPGTEVEMSVVRQGRPIKLKVKRVALTQPATETKTEAGNTGYIHLTSLAAGKADEIKTKLTALKTSGAKRYILDLRGAASGDLAEAVKVANYFIPSGVIVKKLGHNNEEKEVLSANSANAIVTDAPLVVIIDRTTAGPAEAIASAVIENKRGEVTGEKSFGAGTQQELFPLRDGGGMLLTTIRYASGSGKAFLEGGVTPSDEIKRDDSADLSVPDVDSDPSDNSQANPTTPDQTPKKVEPQEDKMLKRAIEILNGAPKTQKKAA